MQAERHIMEESQENSSQSSDVINIQHIVSKMDTLAGLAIKYGVEVADIKKLNGLVTDHLMFALRSVQIPMPGRHPPSPVAENFSASNGPYDDAFDLFSSPKIKSPQFKVTPAMSNLQGYYGLSHPPNSSLLEITETALPTNSSVSNLRLNHHRRTRSLAVINDVAISIAGDTDAQKPHKMKSVRRRQKADTDTDSIFCIPETSENAESFSARAGKGCSGLRVSAAPLGDSSRIDVVGAVRKSSSTSNLQESDSNSSIWPSSMWGMKPDGLPKPMNAWRNKAALD